ncbi:MAG: metallophosphoesterase family protein [Bacilli bacterium]|nr:metallophosphoesterase family protein [Bacilli bacterium]MDD4053926.1 metallophosphoesterase family protein [Bacilli bacterium]
MSDKEVEKIYRYLRNGDSLRDVCNKLDLSINEVYGVVEMLNLNGKQIDLVESEGEIIIVKRRSNRVYKKEKPNKDDLTFTNICVISDTHIGTKEQQLTLINEVYKEAARRNITTVLHCGDLLDGDYIKIRPAHQYQLFLKGFDQQTEYVIDMYPRVKGITTKFIQGSHDETHLKNGGATPGKWIEKCRSDMEYLGQDDYTLTINKVKIKMEHPGGGVAKSLSYKTQDAVEKMTPGNKPNILLQGHYHKCYYMFYRNVHAFLVPCLVNQSQFMKTQGISNIVGAYFLKIYSDEKGYVHYIHPEDYLFKEDQIIKDDYLHCKRLVM